MEFELTETQQLFKRSARELFAQECSPALVREVVEKGLPYPEPLWQKMVEQGWTGLIFSEEDGGLGLGMVEMAVAFEEMGRALVPSALLSTVPLAGSLIAAVATGERRAELLQAISEGKARATVALLEENADWDTNAATLSATQTGDVIRLNGRKLFVTDAAFADYIITSARLGSELALSLINRDVPGVSIQEMPTIDATRRLYEVAFDGAEISATDVLARGEEARKSLARAIDVATLAVAAEMVGGMQWLLDAAVEYAKTRKQFGKPIGQFQAVQHHCANMLLMTESARSAVYYAAWVMGNEPEQAPLAVSMAKAYASDSIREVGNLCVQVHGGIGFTWEHDVHFYYKRAKSSELLFGDATYHRERIARLIVDEAVASEKSISSAAD
ncbi:MAG TPA: acyl-CoA dehydrogenase family protein [Blastocatellia bacterium]|nr:acyl-CoA dehydrogenase family protein [Blastocatellia bacterium]